MKPERNIQILTCGIKAAHERMFSRPQRPEYPKDFEKLYGWLEDKVFNLYEAIRLKKTLHVRDVSADIIVTACELVEYAEEVTDIAGGGKEAPGWRVRS